MRKLFMTTVLGLLLINGQSFGQAFQKGDKLINGGLGLVGLGLNATGEYGIAENIGIGAFVGYERNSYNYYYTAAYGGNYSRGTFNFGARGVFHVGDLLKLDSKFDPYVAGGVGVNVYTDPYWDFDYNRNTYISKSFVSPTILLRIGGRYYFSEKTAAFGEIGTGGSWLSGGISFKF